MASDVVLAEDESAVLRNFHERVVDEIGDGHRESDDAASSDADRDLGAVETDE